jgi:hypothetical protein
MSKNFTRRIKNILCRVFIIIERKLTSNNNVRDEKVDQEIINNIDDVELNNMLFEETDDEQVQDNDYPKPLFFCLCQISNP